MSATAELHASALIDATGVSTGTFYAYFDDAEDVVDALIDRFLDGFVMTLRHAFDDASPETIVEATTTLIDQFVAYQRTEPGFRAIWYGRGLLPQQHDADHGNDAKLVALAAELFVAHGLLPLVNSHVLSELGLNWRIGDALIGEAFRRDPNGDEYVISEAKRTLVLRLRATS